MRKYFTVLILGLFLGVCFARSAYSQENYFTPMAALQEASKENSDSEEVKEYHEFYYKQYTYPFYVESINDFETKYVLYLRSTQYEDVDVTLTYIQPYFIYSDMQNTVTSILTLLTCIQDNIEQLQDTIDYCNLLGYDKSVKAVLGYWLDYYVRMHENIREEALKYIDCHAKEDLASCVNHLILIENAYWDLYIKISRIENPTGLNTIKIQYE